VGSEKRKIVMVNELRSAMALIILRLLMLLKRKIMIRKRLKQEPPPKPSLLSPPPPLRPVTFMGIMLKALFRIGFVS